MRTFLGRYGYGRRGYAVRRQTRVNTEGSASRLIQDILATQAFKEYELIPSNVKRVELHNAMPHLPRIPPFNFPLVPGQMGCNAVLHPDKGPYYGYISAEEVAAIEAKQQKEQ